MTAKRKPELLIHGINPYKSGRSEKYMGPRQLKHFEAILRAWRAELTDETSVPCTISRMKLRIIPTLRTVPVRRPIWHWN